ncbi:MAG: 6-pyruvoyl tetrahydropterin synthase family protein [Nitrospira sp.]
MYTCTKTYNHSEGLSTTFRQWRAESHCRYLHGYALKVELTFVSRTLNDKNWVVDFGSLKGVKDWLKDMFDHKTVVAADDPEMGTFRNLESIGLIQMRIIPHVGMEAFAEYIGRHVDETFTSSHLIRHSNNNPRVTLCRVSEHEGNSATWMNTNL